MKISSNGLMLAQLIWGPASCAGFLLAGDWVFSMQSQVVNTVYCFALVYVVMAPAIYRAFFWSDVVSAPAAPAGGVVVTKHPDGRILCVTRQAPGGQVLSIISTAGQDDGTRMAAAAQAAEAEHRQDVASAPVDALTLRPLVEPVTIGKALLAHRQAHVVLSGGVGPAAAVFLVNISLTAWVHTEATANAYADGYNTALKQLRSALLDAAPAPTQSKQGAAQ